jgi:transcriptional regulator with XRE-family HTH domain
MATFGERLKALREERRMKQPELAEALGVSLNTILVWEKEKRMPRKGFDFFKAAKFFDVSYFYLMGISDERQEKYEEITAEEATRMLDEDALVYIIGAVRKYRDLSDEMQFMVRQALESAYEVDRERIALRSQEAAERGKTYEDKIIALFESDYFKKAFETVYYPENDENQ